MKSTSKPITKQFMEISLKVLAFLLWIITTIVSIISTYLLYKIALSVYAHFSGDIAVATVLGYVVALLSAFACMITVIATGEYHRKHVGTRESWTVFAWTVAIELLILILYFVV